MARLGAHVVYLAAGAHLTTATKVAADKTPTTLIGSIHHPELQEFAGLTTRVHADGRADLIVFPPGRPPVHVENVREDDEAEGTEVGTFVYAEDHKPRKKIDPRTPEQIEAARKAAEAAKPAARS